MIPKLLRIAMVVTLAALAPRAFAQPGYITMSSTGYPDSVAIDVTVQDPGGYPGFLPCNWLGVTRGSAIIGVIERHPGSTTTQHVVDTNVEPNTIYCYRMVLLATPDAGAPLYCNFDPNSLCTVFDCFYDIQTCANTGPGPAFLGHGFLTTENVDHNEVNAFINACDLPPGQWGIALHTISGTAAPYVDSGTAVNVYGEPLCCWAQGVWLLEATAATPQSCVVAVEPITWGAVKAMYRN